MKIELTDNNGQKIECEIIFTFHDDSNDINYVVYTDGTKDDNGELKIYSSRYIIQDNKYILKDIENDYEWNLIDNMIESRFKDAEG